MHRCDFCLQATEICPERVMASRLAKPEPIMILTKDLALSLLIYHSHLPCWVEIIPYPKSDMAGSLLSILLSISQS
jgi:hypothetical protein